MKTKPGFNLRNVCGEHIIIAEGDENIDFSNIISMNESSAYLWKRVQSMESFTTNDLVKLLLEQYEVDKKTARNDVEMLAAQWKKAEIIEGDDIPDIEVEVIKPMVPQKKDISMIEPSKKGILKRLFGKYKGDDIPDIKVEKIKPMVQQRKDISMIEPSKKGILKRLLGK